MEPRVGVADKAARHGWKYVAGNTIPAHASLLFGSEHSDDALQKTVRYLCEATWLTKKSGPGAASKQS
jgi:hypothetical protein